MSLKEEKAKNAEKRLRNYIQKKYGEINPEFVKQDYEDMLRSFNEAINKRRIPE